MFSAFYPQDGAEPGKGFLVGYKEGKLITEPYQNCGMVYDAPPPQPGTGGDAGGVSQGGSLARFAVLGDYLYTVDGDAIQSFRLESAHPVLFNRTSVDFGIETLFPYTEGPSEQLVRRRESGALHYGRERPRQPAQTGRGLARAEL